MVLTAYETLGEEKLSELEYKLKQIIQTEAQREKTEK